ncbi:MAG: glycoside hydrolase family 2 TIM barrel-domain containing protein [bacterium]
MLMGHLLGEGCEGRLILGLEGYWCFRTDPGDKGLSEGWASGWGGETDLLYVPGIWNEQLPRYDQYRGTAWYFRPFRVPSGISGKALWLEFEGVNYLAEVWVNGEKVGQHEGAFTPFKFRVDDLVKPGAENIVAVRVNNRYDSKTIPQGVGPNMAIDWPYTGGIHRPVRLLACPKEHIEDITVRTYLESEDRARVDVHLSVTREGTKPNARSVDFKLMAPDGKLPASARVDLEPFEDRAEGQATLRVSPYLAWTPEEPNLYKLSAALVGTDGAQTDAIAINVGIRQIEIGDGKILLNGKPYVLKGAGRVEYFPVLSRSLDPAISLRDYDCLKYINANSYRPAGYCPPIHEVELADRMGIFIFMDIPCPKALRPELQEALKDPMMREKGEKMLREAISQFKNNPSVFAWDLATEMPVHTDQARNYLGNSYRVAKELDPTRPVFFVDNSMFAKSKDGREGRCGEFSDFIWMWFSHGWNIYGAELDEGLSEMDDKLEYLHEKYPGKPIVIEFYGGHSIPGLPSEFSTMWTDKYQVNTLRQVFSLLKSKPYVQGYEIWMLNDYRTRQSTERAFYHFAGLFTVLRSPKPAADAVREMFEEKRQTL